MQEEKGGGSRTGILYIQTKNVELASNKGTPFPEEGAERNLNGKGQCRPGDTPGREKTHEPGERRSKVPYCKAQ